MTTIAGRAAPPPSPSHLPKRDQLLAWAAATGCSASSKVMVSAISCSCTASSAAVIADKMPRMSFLSFVPVVTFTQSPCLYMRKVGVTRTSICIIILRVSGVSSP